MKLRKYYAAPVKLPSIKEAKHIAEINIPCIKDMLCETRPVMYDGNRKLVSHNLYSMYVHYDNSARNPTRFNRWMNCA